MSGATTKHDFLNGQSNGTKQVYVALLNQSGDLHNPPVLHSISVNYQSGGGGYQSGGRGTKVLYLSHIHI